MHIYTKTIYGMWIMQEVYNLFSGNFFYQYSVLIRTAFAISSIRKRENIIKEVQEVFINTQTLQFLLGKKKKTLKKLGLLKTKLLMILNLIIQSYSLLNE